MPIEAIAAPIGGALLGGLFGGTKPSTNVAVPKDMQGLRGNTINLLQYLLGMGGGMPGQGGFAPAPVTPAAPFGGGGGIPGRSSGNQIFGMNPTVTRTPTAGSRPNIGPGMPTDMLGGLGGALRGISGLPGGPNAGIPSQGIGGPGSPLQGFFGPLGQPTTGLQRQSINGLSQMLNQPAPEMQALQQSMPMLQSLLGNNPGFGVMQALQPMFDRNLAQANQQGGRFGSANAIMRSKALEDYNLLAAQAAQQGVNQQLQGANMLGILSQAAGQNPFQRMAQGYGVGQAESGQQDVETQRRLQLIQSLFGNAMGASFGLPITQTPSGFQQGADLGGTIGQILALRGMFGGGND